MRKYRNSPTKCIISTSPLKVEGHCQRVLGYQKDNRQICTYVIIVYIDCWGYYIANSPHYISRHKENVGTWKKKVKAK